MRHRQARHRLNRFTSWRKATLISLARNILTHQGIRTTEARAKAARPLIEKLIALSKKDTLAARRRAFQILSDHALVSRLFKEIGPRFVNRASGFSRIIHFTQRRGDGARQVIFELTEIKKKERKTPKKEKVHAPEPSAEAAEPIEEKKAKAETQVKEKPPVTKKPTKTFLGGLKGIFKKERDSL